MRAVILSALFGALLAQVAGRLEPLHTTLQVFSARESSVAMAVGGAVFSVLTLLAGGSLATRAKKGAPAYILLTGVLIGVCLARATSGGYWMKHTGAPLEFVLSLLELGLCFGPAALLANWAAPNYRIERTREP